MADGGEHTSPEVRVSDADRAHVVELLKRHTADGLLTLDEFSRRAGDAWAAGKRGELDELVGDLPAAAEARPASLRLPSTRWTVAVMGDNSRMGRWRVAPRTNAFTVMGRCHLDLRMAEFTGDDIEINAAAVMGDIDIVVPEGIDVELDGLPVMGDKRLVVRDIAPIPGSPRVRVRALAVMGTVTVRSDPRAAALRD